VANRFTPGNAFKVPVSGDRVAYGVMLDTRPYFAFYSELPSESESHVETPLFFAAVHKSAYSTDRWGVPVLRLPKSSLPAIPPFFLQDVLNPAQCEIVDHHGNSRNARPEDCVNLERSAVWEGEHIEQRLLDHYEGRENDDLESMKVKLPPTR
jgi:hypothetical protein